MVFYIVATKVPSVLQHRVLTITWLRLVTDDSNALYGGHIASGFIKALVWCNSIETWDVQMVTLQTFTLYAIQQGLVSLQ